MRRFLSYQVFKLFFAVLLIFGSVACRNTDSGVKDSSTSVTKHCSIVPSNVCEDGNVAVLAGAADVCDRNYNAVKNYFGWDFGKIALEWGEASSIGVKGAVAWVSGDSNKIFLDCSNSKKAFQSRSIGNYGVIVHEMAHLFQRKLKKNSSFGFWLEEGMADVVRHRILGEDSKCNGTPEEGHYSKGYSCAAAMLEYAQIRVNDAKFYTKVHEGLLSGATIENILKSFGLPEPDKLFSDCVKDTGLCSIFTYERNNDVSRKNWGY